MKKLIPITVVLLGLFAYVYFFHIRPSRQVDPTVRGQGSIEATSYQVTSRLAARILEIPAEEGDKVEKGDLIARLDCADLEARRIQAQAQVVQAEAAVVQARAALDQAVAAKHQGAAAVAPLEVGTKHAKLSLGRARSLHAADGVPEKSVDDAEAAFDSAREQMTAARVGVKVAAKGVTVAKQSVEVAKAAVESAKAAVHAVEVQMEECTLTAPAGGVVMRISREAGESVLPGSAMAKIGDIDDAYTWIYVSNEEVGKLSIGQRVSLQADTYRDRSFYGRVVRISEEAEFTPRSIQTKDDRTRLVFGVKVAVDNGDGALLPGMPVEATIIDESTGAESGPMTARVTPGKPPRR